MKAELLSSKPAGRPRIAEDALRRLPERLVGSGAYVAIATRQCVQELLGAIASGQRYRVANAIRALSHTPSSDQLFAIVTSVCDSISSSAARSGSDVRDIALQMDDVRAVALQTLQTLRARREVESRIPADLKALVTGLVRVAEAQMPGSSDHLEATAALAARIALTLDLDLESVARVETAAKLHDIGNVAVPHSAMLHHTPASYDENDAARIHSTAGASIVADIPALRRLAPIIRSHHERFDGLGYPDGLRGAEISIESRIIAVADAFHTVSNHQIDAPPMNAAEALLELQSHAGTHFDPSVLTAASDLLRFPHHQRAQSA